jgi:hypothetical protein
MGLTGKVAHHHCMGDAIEIVATKLLTDGVASSYPGVNPWIDSNDRFIVQLIIGENGTESYNIIDLDLEADTTIPKTWLEEPEFDLVSWYRRHLSLCGVFEHRYYDAHAKLYTDKASTTGNNRNYGSVPMHLPVFSLKPDLGSEWDDLPELEALSESSDGGDLEEDRDELEVDSEDIPPLESLSDDSGEEEGGNWQDCPADLEENESEFIERINTVLTKCQPFPGDGEPVDPSYNKGDPRFIIERRERGFYCVYDRVQGFEADIHVARLRWEFFSIGKWFAERCAVNSGLEDPGNCAHQWLLSRRWGDTTMGLTLSAEWSRSEEVEDQGFETVELLVAGIQVDKNRYPALQRNAAQVKGNQRILPKPLVVKVTVNNHPARALLDSGSLGDFMSSTLADQLKIKRETLDVPLSLQLAIQGSRSKVNTVVTAQLQYQGINEQRTFDVINLNSYDLILGTPWMHQHQICIGFNPARVVIGSDEALPLKVGNDTKLMVHTLSPDNQNVENVREELRKYADPLCREVHETDLPPLRAINHTIPLVDESKTYSWRPSRCPEAFRAQWAEKRDAYVKSGRWRITSARNTVPMLLIPKPGTNPPLLRMVVDLRERNKNSHKMTSPIPDMDGMLRRTASKPFRTSLDLKNAYELIRIVPEHVERSAVTTPDGNMVSMVAQQGDCNAPATYQALMQVGKTHCND